MNIVLLSRDLCKILSNEKIQREIENVGIKNRMTLITTITKYGISPSREFLEILEIVISGASKEQELLTTHPKDEARIEVIRNMELILERCKKCCMNLSVSDKVNRILIKYRSTI